jgi:hypothetical protein
MSLSPTKVDFSYCLDSREADLSSVFALPIGQGELSIYKRLQNKIYTRREIDNHNNSNNINS